MKDDEIITQIIHSFSNYNLRDIKEINNNQLEFTIAEFILCSCFIDQVSGFRYNNDKVGKRYRQFIKDYLPNYDPDNLYNDLRNKLVHNYSVGGYYGLTRRSPQLHLKKVKNIIFLNLETFISDLEDALRKFASELKNDKTIRGNALKWFSVNKILTQIS